MPPEWQSGAYGQDPAVLVWRGASLGINPSLDPRVVAEALERDEASARAEYLAEFRADLQSFIDTDAVARVVVPGRWELEPMPPDAVDHCGFVDPSGGSGSDSFTLSVAHGEEEEDGRIVAVLDAVHEWPDRRYCAPACRSRRHEARPGEPIRGLGRGGTMSKRGQRRALCPARNGVPYLWHNAYHATGS